MIKSARVMKKAVGYLTPFMEEEKRAKLLAEGGDPDQPQCAQPPQPTTEPRDGRER